MSWRRNVGFFPPLTPSVYLILSLSTVSYLLSGENSGLGRCKVYHLITCYPFMDLNGPLLKRNRGSEGRSPNQLMAY
jgi:hypothetical protein